MTNVIHEPRNQRHHSRIEMRGKATLDGIEGGFELLELSISGCRIAGDIASLRTTAKHIVRLVIPFRNFDLKLAGQVQVIRVNADAGQAGLHFIDTDDHRSTLIRRLVLGKIAGEFVDLDGMMASTTEPAVPAEVSPPPSPHYVRYGVLLALGVLLAVTVLFSLYTALFTIKSDFASVTVPVTRLAAPEEGLVSAVMVGPGDIANKGQPLFSIRNFALEKERRILIAGREVLDARLISLSSELEGSRAMLDSYRRSVGNKVDKLEAEVAQLRIRLMSVENILKRKIALSKNDFASLTEVDELQIERTVIEAELLRREDALFQAQRELELLGLGVKPADQNLDQRFPFEVEAELAVVGAERAAANSQIAMLDQRLGQLTVVSPCDCVITTVSYAPDEQVAANSPVVEVRPLASVPVTVEMVVPQDKIGMIRIGDKADVILADRSNAITGRVVRLARVKPEDGRRGVPKEIYDQQAGATVYVEVPIDDALEPGLPAQVSIGASLSAVSMDIFGVDLVPW